MGLVSDSDQLVASLDTIESDLADDLIEALGEELLADGADAIGSGAELVDLFIEALLQVQDIGACGGGS